MGCPTSQIDHIDLVYLQQGNKMFLGSKSKTATLIELNFFGSDHMNSESDHENKNFGGFSDQNLKKLQFLEYFGTF